MRSPRSSRSARSRSSDPAARPLPSRFGRPTRPALAAVACGLFFALAIPAPAPAQEADAPPEDPAQTRLTLDRYFDMEGVGDPRISPDGERIVYARQWMDPMNDGRKSALWIMNADGSRNRHLVEGSLPRWSPSGDRIAFLACGTPGSPPPTARSGGSPRAGTCSTSRT